MGWNDHPIRTRHAAGNAYSNEKPEQAIRPRTLRDVLQGVVDVVRWDKGFADCLCPACERTDARLFYDGMFPVVHCFGSGCADFNAGINAELASRTKQLCGERGFKLELTEQDKAQLAFRRELKKVEAQARNRLLPQLLKQPLVALDRV
jgi:hypothetical protein